MAKPTGFMDYERVENGSFKPLERIENFKEFHPVMEDAKRREQAARCMNCGVPMCQSAIKLAGMVTGDHLFLMLEVGNHKNVSRF